MPLVAPSQFVVETLGGSSEHRDGSGSADPTFATGIPSAEGLATSSEALILRAETIASDRFLGSSSGSALGGDHNNIQIHNQNTYLLHPRPTVSPATSTPTVIEESGGRRYESATETYTRIILAKHIGYPLWTPEPFNIPPEYEAEGIQVGDIGIVNEDGLFEFSFNFCRPADDPINSAFPLPSSFVPFTYAPVQIVQTDDVFRPNTIIGNGSVRGRLTYPSRQTGDEAGLCQFQFDCLTPEGALLALPTGACRTNFRSSFRPRLLLHARKHALSWLEWVYGSLDLASSIYLITGYDKCDNWCLASYSNVPAEIGVSLSFTPEADSGGIVQYSPQSSGDITARTFLRRGIISKNQCLFLRGYRITTCRTLQERLRRGAIKISDIVSQTTEDPTGAFGIVPGAAVLDWFISQLLNGNGNGKDNTSGKHHNDSFQIESFPSPSRVHHPADIINLYLLIAHPTAQVAITHDDDWCGVIEENDIAFPDAAELLRRVLKKYRQVQEGDCVTLVPGEDQAVMVDPLRSVGHQTEDFGAEASPVPHAVRACLSCIAVPRLSPSLTLFKLIWSLNRRIQPPEQQMESLVLSVAQLLQNLHGELLTGRIPPSSGHTEIADLYSILTDIATFITDKTERGVLIVPVETTIENYRHRFESCAFQISELIRVQRNVDSPAHTPLFVPGIHGHRGQAVRGKSLSIADSAAPTKTREGNWPSEVAFMEQNTKPDSSIRDEWSGDLQGPEVIISPPISHHFWPEYPALQLSSTQYSDAPLTNSNENSDSCSSPSSVGSHLCDITPDLTANIPSHSSTSTPGEVSPERPFACDFPDCPRRFKTPYARKSHMETHRSIRPSRFPCILGCSMQFTRQHDRLRHEVAKHGRVCEWTCDDCRRFFSSQRTLAHHKCSKTTTHFVVTS